MPMKNQKLKAVTRIGVLAFLTLVPLSSGGAREVVAQPGCPVPIRPWEFLDASSQIEFIPDTPGTNVFRAAQFGDFNNDGRLDVVMSCLLRAGFQLKTRAAGAAFQAR